MARVVGREKTVGSLAMSSRCGDHARPSIYSEKKLCPSFRTKRFFLGLRPTIFRRPPHETIFPRPRPPPKPNDNAAIPETQIPTAYEAPKLPTPHAQ